MQGMQTDSNGVRQSQKQPMGQASCKCPGKVLNDFMLTGNSPTGGQGLTGHVSDQLTYPNEYTDDVNPDHPHLEPSIIYEREHIELALPYVS